LEIAPYAFYGCRSLSAIQLPETLVKIGSCAFYECKSLRAITIPEGFEEIGYHAFFKASSLSTVTYNAANATLAEISNAPFETENYYGTSVYIGNTVVTIPDGLFENSNVHSLIFKPDSICRTIGARAFATSELRGTLELPDSLTEIGDSAFAKTKLSDVILPTSLVTIGAEAFHSCESLSLVYISSGVETLGANVFSTEAKLTVIYCAADSKPSGWDESWDSNTRTVLYGYNSNITYTFVTNNSTTLESVTSILPITLPVPESTDNMLRFAGWYTDESFSGTAYTREYYSKEYTTLYAKWETPDGSSFGDAYPIIEKGDYLVTVNTGEAYYICFKPTVSGYYTITSIGDYDTFIELYDSALSRFAYNDNGGANSNFYVSLQFFAGNTYYLKICNNSSDNASFTVVIN